jgi:lantibiotic modifying enzyme
VNETTTWRPILEGDLAARAEGAVEEIAEALKPVILEPEKAQEFDAETPSWRRSRFALAGGRAGQSILFTYLDQAFPGRGYDDVAAVALEQASEDLAEVQAPPGLYSGFSGVSWAVEHLQGRLIETEDDPGEDIAAALAEHLEITPWRGDYDLISGLVGYGVYALERLPRRLGRECVERVVARLDETAEKGEGTVTWLTRPELLPPKTRDENPEGNYNAGVAHGVPGVISLLGEVCAAGIAVDRARPLLEGAVAWTLAHKLPSGASIFPYSVIPGEELRPTRLAWCYGDLGIAAALLNAGRRLGEAAWESEAVAVARAGAARPTDLSGVVDAGLCHGAAGNAHIFNRLYQATGDPDLLAAARFWFDYALGLRKPGEGLAGFLAYVPDAEGDLGWHRDAGFLTGVSGIALAMLGALAPIAPDWDHVLLTSVPPRS